MTEAPQPGAWRDAEDACPCCQRPFNGVMDYPRIRLLRVDQLGLPEILDYYSDEALRRQVGGESGAAVIRTQELADALSRPDVRAWLESLGALGATVIEPAALLGTWPAGRFKTIRELTGTTFSIGVSDEPFSGDQRSCSLNVLLPGPSLGSAGGPTLAHVGSLARITYVGLVASHL